MIFLLVLGSGVAIFNVLKLANLAEDMYKHHLVASNIVRDEKCALIG
jgi:F0F1-type ATP synthase assembly protein I